MKKMLMIGGGVVLLVVISVSISIVLMNTFFERGGPVVEKIVEVEVQPKPVETFYHEFDPEFVANFSGDSEAKFLMTEITVVTEDEAVLGILAERNPEIRNDLLMLFGEQDGGHVITNEGRMELREKTLKTVQNVVEKHYGKPGVKDVYFTRFVVQ